MISSDSRSSPARSRLCCWERLDLPLGCSAAGPAESRRCCCSQSGSICVPSSRQSCHEQHNTNNNTLSRQDTRGVTNITNRRHHTSPGWLHYELQTLVLCYFSDLIKYAQFLSTIVKPNNVLPVVSYLDLIHFYWYFLIRYFYYEL